MENNTTVEKKLENRIKHVIASNDIVLYMKGTAFYPLCGYSAAIAQMLNYLGASYIDIDVLENPELAVAVKKITKWPFIPQLFIKGEFVGGFDKIRSMFDDGSLIDLLIHEKISMNAESYYFNKNKVLKPVMQPVVATE